MSAILNDQVPEITWGVLPTGDPLLNVTHKCLKKSSADRYQNFVEVMTALNTSEPTPAGAQNVTKWVAVAGGIAMLIALAIAFTRSANVLADSTGKPGPWTGRFPRDEEDHAVQVASWYESRAYAGFVDKRIPTRYHESRTFSAPRG